MKATISDARLLDREELIQQIVETNCGYSTDQLDDFSTDDLCRIWVRVMNSED